MSKIKHCKKQRRPYVPTLSPAPSPTFADDRQLPLFSPDADEAPAPDTGLYIGIDEAGRGCLAGPVVAAAVLFPRQDMLPEVLADLDDSKKLTASRRSLLVNPIKDYAPAWGLGLSWPGEIDRINILNATFRAMSRAVLALRLRLLHSAAGLPPPKAALSASLAETAEPAATGFHTASPQTEPQNARPIDILRRPVLPLYIDGDHPIAPAHWQACTALPLPPQRTVIGGDGLDPSIAAASVLAKTFRDSLMCRLALRFPQYSFDKHKGYAAGAHIAALEQHGPCPLHRLTFNKVRPAARSGEKHLPLLLPDSDAD